MMWVHLKQRHPSSVHRLVFALIACWVAVPASPMSAQAACKMTIEPIQQLHLKRFYTDTNGSQVRAEIRAANRAQTRPLKTFLTSIADFADRAVHFQDRYAARCGIDALSTWARAGALLGKMPTKQGEHHRKWALTGLALSYLKLKPWTTLEDRNRINPWLQAMADNALAVFENPKIKRNNHLYWLGLALAAVGESTASDRHWDQAEAILDEALDGIPSSGMLPLEMARGAKALHYHVFAVTPLVVLEWLARQSGRPVASTQRVALDRLIDRTLEGVSDPF